MEEQKQGLDSPAEAPKAEPEDKVRNSWQSKKGPLVGVAVLLVAIIAGLILLASQDRGLDPESASAKLLSKFDAPAFPNEINNLSVIDLSNPVFGVEHMDGESHKEVKSGDLFSNCSSTEVSQEALSEAVSLGSRTLNDKADSDEYFLYSDRIFQEIIKFKSREQATLFADSIKEGVFDATCNAGLYDEAYSLRSDIEYTRSLDSFGNITENIPEGDNVQAFKFTKTLYFSPVSEEDSWFSIENVTRIGVAVNGADVTIIRFTLSQLVINEFDLDAFYAQSDRVIDLSIARFYDAK
jgi:hypothetical protein